MTKSRRKGTGRKYGEGHIEIRPTKTGVARYAARWYEEVPGKKPRLAQRTFATQDEAEDHLRQVARDKRDGRYVSSSQLTVEGVIEEWLKRNRPGWKGTTYATYRQRAYVHIIPAIGKVRVVELTPARVQRWADDMVAAGVVAPKTVMESKRVISAAMNEAVRLDIIRENPARSVRVASRPTKRHKTWTEDEVGAILDYTASRPMWHAVYSVILMTGMRPGELRALKWSDIDFRYRTIKVERTITRTDSNQEIVGDTTKTGDTRVVSAPEDTIAALKAWKVDQAIEQLRAPIWDDGKFVFTGSEGQFLPHTKWSKFHTGMIFRTGVTRITLHECRHTNATLELAHGTHPKIVSDRLGHRKIETTLDLYSHVSPDLHRNATDALAERVRRKRKKASGE